MKHSKKIMIIIAACLLSACSGTKEVQETTSQVNEVLDQKLNTQEGNLAYSSEKVSESELIVNPGVDYVDGYYVDFENSKDSKLYVATYEYDGKEFTAGYAKNCDFKEYLALPDIESAEADTINGYDYNIAYYKDNVKAGYYYANENVCVYIHTEDVMTADEFKKEIAEIGLKADEGL